MNNPTDAFEAMQLAAKLKAVPGLELDPSEAALVLLHDAIVSKATNTFYVLGKDEASEVFEQTNGRKPTEQELERMESVFGNALSDGTAADYMRIAAEEAAK